MRIERLEKILKLAPNIENLTTDPDEYGFNRTFEFDVRGAHYKIVWYVNESTLKVGELQISFDRVTVDGFWPNGFKTNLNFLWKGEKICVLPIEEYAPTAK